MNETAPDHRPPLRWGRRLAAAAAVALIAAITYQAIGVTVFSSRLRSDDPRAVVVAHYEARRAGFAVAADRALDSRVLEERRAPNYRHPLVDDALLARDLEVSQGAVADFSGAWFAGRYAEVRLFTVTYRSLWREQTGAPPGPRHWFVYTGRNPGRPWKVLGEGTGP